MNKNSLVQMFAKGRVTSIERGIEQRLDRSRNLSPGGSCQTRFVSVGSRLLQRVADFPDNAEVEHLFRQHRLLGLDPLRSIRDHLPLNLVAYHAARQ